MHILTVTTLFPNLLQPVHGLFIKARMEDYTRRYGHRWTVIAPVPYFPRLPFKVSPLYDAYARVPYREEAPGRVVYHPRYLVTPKMGMGLYGTWMAAAVRGLARRLHAEHPIDVVDGHYIYPDGSAALAAGKAIGAPVCLSARGTDLHTFSRLPRIRPRLQANLAASDHFVGVSADLARIARGLGLDESRISVIGNGVDASRFRPRDRTACRARLGLADAAPLFLGVGRLVPGKGFDLAIRALARLPDRSARLALAGSGGSAGDLKALASGLGVADRVLLPGAVPNDVLPDWYGAADAFVIASLAEGWPNAPCEALACGTPVIGIRIPGLEEIVHDPGLGELVEGREPEVLAGALERALRRPWDRAAIGRAGAMRTWEHVSAQLEPVFSELAARTRRHRAA